MKAEILLMPGYVGEADLFGLMTVRGLLRLGSETSIPKSMIIKAVPKNIVYRE